MRRCMREGVRRGGTLVTARVPDADRARLDAVLNQSAVNLGERRAAWQKSGWNTFDPASKPYGAEEVRKERQLVRRRTALDSLRPAGSPAGLFLGGVGQSQGHGKTVTVTERSNRSAHAAGESYCGTGRNIHSRHTVSKAAMMTGPRNKPKSPKAARPPKIPTKARRNGRRAEPPTRVGHTK